MKPNIINLIQYTKDKFNQFKQEDNYSAIAKLITYSFKVNNTKSNWEIFGYIPKIFRTVEISLDEDDIQSKHIFIGEPVVYKIFYPNNKELYNLKYFYIFCYLKEKSDRLNVYFQSADPRDKSLSQKNYHLEQEKINFEGSISGFADDNISVISISDPGHFIPDLPSSFYLGSITFNFNQLIAEVLEKIAKLSKISHQEILLFGSSAGTFGALLSSSYFKKKVNVLTVNSQITIQYRKDIMEYFFCDVDEKELVEKFGSRFSCFHRFKQPINSIPNIYILANINDRVHQRNVKFHQLYLDKFVLAGENNQSVFDSYYGVDGHGRPRVSSLKAKIKIAREILTMDSRNV